ncbi:MJ1255/VC2487 family glycosyltransferase [Agaribacter flavus]|uniref:MJ1255/VC2487 family glycosyltransferase n=1 Tax=Agaribacter flavus TaxID=1902781 RepID=A0ABV7FVD7_9ALTE
MRILYGVQGTGNGHITRARHLAKGLCSKQDIQVDYFFTGRDKGDYFDMEPFGNYRSARGLTFSTNNGRIQHRKTLTENNLFSFVKEVRSLVIKDYDLVINDFEPVTAWAAKLAGVPSLSVSHQAAYLYHVPKQQQGAMDKLITKHFAPTDHSLGTHWYHFGYNIIPPFVAKDLVHQSTVNSSKNAFILVYLPFENIHAIREQLQTLSEYSFVCFHPKATSIAKDKNIDWHPLSTPAFKHYLSNCSGVISNCGFELSTECLSIGKPLLVKPLQRQYEQLSNAYTLKSLGLCDVIHSLNAEEIDEWLQVKKGVKIDYPSDCSAFVDWIAEGNWAKAENICQRLWQHVVFPPEVKKRLTNFVN